MSPDRVNAKRMWDVWTMWLSCHDEEDVAPAEAAAVNAVDLLRALS